MDTNGYQWAPIGTNGNQWAPMFKYIIILQEDIHCCHVSKGRSNVYVSECVTLYRRKKIKSLSLLYFMVNDLTYCTQSKKAQIYYIIVQFL